MAQSRPLKELIIKCAVYEYSGSFIRSFLRYKRMWMSQAGRHLKKDPLKKAIQSVHTKCF
jgi:hypothetical protein